MPKIGVLPDNLINKIAAGEVIERPASVVRELIDNAIDAGSSRIDVEVVHGGRKLIKVSDDGTGMERDDAVLCFERHATSKIRSEEELFHITTLGFRGEALPSIASVAKVTLTTSTEGSPAGTRIEIGANRSRDIAEAPPARGTTVEIRDLFYNTPARRKFLKTVPTELSHIIETVVQKAFAHPAISFMLLHNGNELLNAPSAGDLRERLVQLYGDEMAAELLDVQKDSKAMKIRGFVSTVDVTRAGRSHQIIFVNSRPVRNATVNHAVYHAYRESIAKDRHPVYFLFLDIDPHKVDVNVHPAKREVKFERPEDIHRFAGAAVYEALNPGSEIDLSAPAPVRGAGGFRGTDYQLHRQDSPVVREQELSGLSGSQQDFFAAGLARHVQTFFHVGESFVATVTGDGLVIVDQHAAHERIMYERFLKKTSLESEPLFLPVRIELPLREYQLIISEKDLLRGFGIDLEEFGGNNVIIRSLPRALDRTGLKGLLMDVAAGIVEGQTEGVRDDSAEGLVKNIAARLACHKSVRGSEHLSNEELSQMIADLDRSEEPDRCPHGRPTRISLSLDDLKKMFRRK